MATPISGNGLPPLRGKGPKTVKDAAAHHKRALPKYVAKYANGIGTAASAAAATSVQ